MINLEDVLVYQCKWVHVFISASSEMGSVNVFAPNWYNHDLVHVLVSPIFVHKFPQFSFFFLLLCSLPYYTILVFSLVQVLIGHVFLGHYVIVLKLLWWHVSPSGLGALPLFLRNCWLFVNFVHAHMSIKIYHNIPK